MGVMSASPRPADDRFPDARSAKLAELVEPTVTRRGLFLEELELKPAGSRTALRVVVDYAEGSEQVDLDTLAGLDPRGDPSAEPPASFPPQCGPSP